MVHDIKWALNRHWWWWQWSEEDDDGDDDGDSGDDDNYVDDGYIDDGDESERTVGVPAPQDRTGPGTGMQLIGGDPVTASRWGSGMQCRTSLDEHLVIIWCLEVYWPGNPKEFVAALSLVTW